MSTIEAKLVLSATDKTGATFKALAERFKSLNQTATAFSKIKPPLGWGKEFQSELDRMRISAKSLQDIRRSWDDLHKGLRSSPLPIRAALQVDAINRWKSETISSLRSVGTEYGRLTRLMQRFGGVAGALGGAYAIRRGGRAIAREGAELAVQSSHDKQAGIDDATSKRFAGRALDLSSSYPSLDAATMHQSLRETATGFRSTDTALALSDTVAQGLVLLQARKGKERAVQEMSQFMKGLNTLGITDPGKIREMLDGYTRALAVEGRELDMGGLLSFVRQARGAGGSLSTEFLTLHAPQLMQDLGEARGGTAIASTMAQIVGGMSSKEAIAAQRRFGLRDRGGSVVGQNLLQTNPFEWVDSVLVPALRKQGINPDDAAAVDAVTGKLFPNRSAKDAINKMTVQRDQYRQGADWYRKALGLDSAGDLARRDPFVAMSAFTASLQNFAGTVTGPYMESASRGLVALAGGINSLTKSLSENPIAAGAMGAGATIGGALAAGWGVKKGINFIGGALGGAAGAASTGPSWLRSLVFGVSTSPAAAFMLPFGLSGDSGPTPPRNLIDDWKLPTGYGLKWNYETPLVPVPGGGYAVPGFTFPGLTRSPGGFVPAPTEWPSTMSGIGPESSRLEVDNKVSIELNTNLLDARIKSVVRDEVGNIRARTMSDGPGSTGQIMPEAQPVGVP